MKRNAWLLLLLVLVLACNDNTDKTIEEVSTTEDAATPEEEDILETPSTDYFAVLSNPDVSISKDSFELVEEGKIESLPASTIDHKKLDPFKKFLVYNSDSTKAIDLYSYNYIITKRNGVEDMEEAGPDTEVNLIDLKKNTTRRIFFSGPSFSVVDAKWVGNDEVALAGTENFEEGNIKPVIWQINIKDTTMQQYNYKHAVHAAVHGGLYK